MSAGTITITAGRPNRQGDEKDFSGPDGTYTATLVAVSEPVTEKSSLADAKGDGTWTYRTWTFAIEPERRGPRHPRQHPQRRSQVPPVRHHRGPRRAHPDRSAPRSTSSAISWAASASSRSRRTTATTPTSRRSWHCRRRQAEAQEPATPFRLAHPPRSRWPRCPATSVPARCQRPGRGSRPPTVTPTSAADWRLAGRHSSTWSAGHGCTSRSTPTATSPTS